MKDFLYLLNYKTHSPTATTTDLSIGIMESWLSIWDDLANAKNGLNYSQTRGNTKTLEVRQKKHCNKWHILISIVY